MRPLNIELPSGWDDEDPIARAQAIIDADLDGLLASAQQSDRYARELCNAVRATRHALQRLLSSKPTGDTLSRSREQLRRLDAIVDKLDRFVFDTQRTRPPRVRTEPRSAPSEDTVDVLSNPPGPTPEERREELLRQLDLHVELEEELAELKRKMGLSEPEK